MARLALTVALALSRLALAKAAHLGRKFVCTLLHPGCHGSDGPSDTATSGVECVEVFGVASTRSPGKPVPPAVKPSQARESKLGRERDQRHAVSEKGKRHALFLNTEFWLVHCLPPCRPNLGIRSIGFPPIVTISPGGGWTHFKRICGEGGALSPFSSTLGAQAVIV